MTSYFSLLSGGNDGTQASAADWAAVIRLKEQQDWPNLTVLRKLIREQLESPDVTHRHWVKVAAQRLDKSLPLARFKDVEIGEKVLQVLLEELGRVPYEPDITLLCELPVEQWRGRRVLDLSDERRGVGTVIDTVEFQIFGNKETQPSVRFDNGAFANAAIFQGPSPRMLQVIP